MKSKIIVSFTFIAILIIVALWLIPNSSQFPLVDKKDNNDAYVSNHNGEIKVLKSLADEQEFLANLSIDSANNYQTREMTDGAIMSNDMMAAPESLAMGKESAGLDYSTTNIQVLGVDEADIVKTDGNYIYALVYNDLYIIKAYPPEEMEVISKVSFNSQPTNIFLEGDKLAVMGQDYDIVEDPVYRSFPRSSAYTYFKVFDISDKANPSKVRDLSFEGNYFNARMIDAYVYLITNDYRQIGLIDESLAPKIIDNGKVLTERPDIYYFNIPYSSLTINSINVINLNDISQDVASHSFLLDGASSLYASQEAIYLGLTKYLNQWEIDWQIMYDTLFSYLSEEIKDKIRVIEKTEGFVISESEKKHKIAELFNNFLYSLNTNQKNEIEEKLESTRIIRYEELKDKWETTLVHKIEIDKEKINHVAQAEIPGTVLNQFSFDEHNNNLRVATSKSARMDNQSSSGVYILDDNLKLLSQVDNLAPGERIYSVRFMGDRAYLVTFFEVDPLFALDLSDPLNPLVLGELKIPGFSNYLHPYDANHLIGFGKDTNLNERGGVRTLGLKLSFFNVADIKNPIELDSYVFGGSDSDSIALHDHRAFLFNKDKNLLVVPATLRSSFSSALDFSGAIVFKIEDNKFVERARIDHLDGDISENYNYWGGFRYNDSSVRRSLYIDNYLYTLSNRLIRVHDLDDLNWLSGLRFSSQVPNEIMPYYELQ